MHLPTSFPRRLTGAAVLACTAALMPAAAFAATAAPASWKIAKTVPGNNSPGFDAVTATGPHSAWAFESTSSKPAAWRLSGSRWTQVPFPGTAGEIITSAASTSPDDVWAVEFNGIPGTGARQRVLSWNGTGWAVTASFPGSGGDVVPLSTHDAWFFDGLTPGGATWHYNGYSWSRVRSGSGLTDGSALSPDSIWAVGTGHRATIGGPVVVLHFNGHHWSRVALNDAARDPVPGQVIPDGNGGLWIPTPGFEGRTPSGMLRYSGGHLEFAALPATPGKVLYVNAVTAVPGTRQAIGAGVTYWGANPLGAHQSAVILAYGS